MKNLFQLRTGREFRAHALSHGAEVRDGKGDHVVIRTPKGIAVLPCSNGHEIGKGLRSKIVKAFIAMGLILVLLMAWGLI